MFSIAFPIQNHSSNFFGKLDSEIFKSLLFQRYWELAGAVQTQYARCTRCPLSYKEDAGVAQSWSNRAVDSRMFWYGFVIIP